MALGALHPELVITSSVRPKAQDLELLGQSGRVTWIRSKGKAGTVRVPWTMPVEYRAANPGPGGDAGITRRRAGGSRHKHRGWVRRGQAARIPTWNASPRVGVSTRQGGDVAQEISQSRANIRLATSHSNSIVHAIPGYPASSPGRPFVRL